MTMKNIIYLSRTDRVTDCLTVDRLYGRHLYHLAFVGFFLEGRKELFFFLIVPHRGGCPYRISLRICASSVSGRRRFRWETIRSRDSSGFLRYAEVTKSQPNSVSGVVYCATPQP